MTAKERVSNAVHWLPVDRVPAGIFGTHTEYEEGLAKHVGADSIEDMYQRLGIDIWHCKSSLVRTEPGNLWCTDELNAPPFADVQSIAQVEDYQFADIENFDDSALAAEIEAHQEFSVCGGINSAVFHHYLDLCGQENALCYLRTSPEIASAIIEKITDFFVAYLVKVLEAGRGNIDLIENCNDFGTQRSMFISPDDFRRFFRPQLQRLYDTAKSYDVMYMQHCCGAIMPIIPDFVAMGADILNPIQLRAEGMDINELVTKYRKKIAFYGGIDTQELLPQGPESRIRAEVKKLLDLFGTDGGFILSGSQGFMDDIPYTHVVAMLSEGR